MVTGTCAGARRESSGRGADLIAASR
jgi:hypothetical protein